MIVTPFFNTSVLVLRIFLNPMLEIAGSQKDVYLLSRSRLLTVHIRKLRLREMV